MKGIAEMTANFLIPCLSISEICKSFKIENFSMWAPILVYCLLNVFMGYLIGEIVCMIMKISKGEIRRLVLIVCMFSNSTSMQLIYVDSLSSILGTMINSTEVEAKSKGYVIVLLYTIFVNFLRWSIGFNLMKPTNNSFNITSNREILDNSVRTIPIKESRIVEEDLGKNETVENNSKNIWKLLKEGINMPFVAGVIAILISSIPYVNTFFSNPKYAGYNLLVGKNIYKYIHPNRVL
jgi:predicted permease